MKKAILAFTALIAFTSQQAMANESCDIAWSHYTGWEPVGWIEDTGVADRWGAKYGVDLSFTFVNDYIESINQYTAGTFQGVTVTNMDALTIPAVGGVTTKVSIVGDTSNGNDVLLYKGDDVNSISDLKGKTIYLVEYSVSHYKLARILDMHGLSERDVNVVNVSDADIGGMIASAPAGSAYVTWNPIALEARNVEGVKVLATSADIPGEIIDAVMVNADASENCHKAATGAWYEAMSAMNARGNEKKEMIAFLADQAGGTVPEYVAQLRTTNMFYTPGEALNFVRDDQLKETMQFVAKFSFDKGLYGDGAPDEKFVGIQFADGSVWGNPNNVQLIFTDEYMNAAAEGSL